MTSPILLVNLLEKITLDAYSDDQIKGKVAVNKSSYHTHMKSFHVEGVNTNIILSVPESHMFGSTIG